MVLAATVVGVVFGVEAYKKGKYCELAWLAEDNGAMFRSRADKDSAIEDLKRYAPRGAKDVAVPWANLTQDIRRKTANIGARPDTLPEQLAAIEKLVPEADLIEFARLTILLEADFEKRCS